MATEFIERKIIIGFISSTEYLRELSGIWKDRYLTSVVTKHISRWCWEYFRKYNKAPGSDIDGILYQKSQAGLNADITEEIEEDILPGLNDEYMAGNWDITYLLEETKKYIAERRLLLHAEEIQTHINQNDITAAENLASSYKPSVDGVRTDLDLGSQDAITVLEKAFDTEYTSIIQYPKQLGTFINHQLVRGGFVALLAPEKRGKTFMLMDMAVRATRQGKKVAFFQAGDMTESQMIMRMAIHLTKKNNKEKYSGIIYQPVRDCVLNQLNLCDKPQRESDFGIFESKTRQQVKYEIEFADILEAMKDEPDYRPCHNCSDYDHQRLGTVWLTKVDTGDPLTKKQAVDKWYSFFKRYKHRFKLSTHANGTLSTHDILAILDMWERRDDFVPELIVIDYADLLIFAGANKEFRHQQNEIWKALRAISQQKNQPLVITATQADAASYSATKLQMKHFSEDKRKFAHVTAMYGLNQDPGGRDKKLGILRINEIVVREGDFDSNSQVYVLQSLARGQAVSGSFF